MERHCGIVVARKLFSLCSRLSACTFSSLKVSLDEVESVRLVGHIVEHQAWNCVRGRALKRRSCHVLLTQLIYRTLTKLLENVFVDNPEFSIIKLLLMLRSAITLFRVIVELCRLVFNPGVRSPIIDVLVSVLICLRELVLVVLESGLVVSWLSWGSCVDRSCIGRSGGRACYLRCHGVVISDWLIDLLGRGPGNFRCLGSEAVLCG